LNTIPDCNNNPWLQISPDFWQFPSRGQGSEHISRLHSISCGSSVWPTSLNSHRKFEEKSNKNVENIAMGWAIYILDNIDLIHVKS
jgi:hypothetical protein